MTRLRQTIAKRLKEAQDTAAMLTTFNDVDMSAVMQMRKDYRDAFEKKHGVKLGFMGFFVKACVAGLEGHSRGQRRDRRRRHRLQELLPHRRRRRHRARPRRSGVARSRHHEPCGDRGRDRRFRPRAPATASSASPRCKAAPSPSPTAAFTARCCRRRSSTRRNRAFSACTRIEERAVVRDGQIVARPMMYLALSYDHRVVDGKEAVTFLVNVKE